MSDQIKHECGVVLIRLLKPLSFYQKKYGSAMYGLNKLYLMMEKQHNRGQEGAGLACVKINAKPGTEYIFRQRALGNTAISECFANVNKEMEQAKKDLGWSTEGNAAEKVGAEKIVAEKMGADRMGAEKMGVEKMGVEKMGVEKMGVEKIGVEKIVAEKMGVEKMGADRMGVEKMGAEKMGAEKMGAEKMGAEKAEDMKIQAEKERELELPYVGEVYIGHLRYSTTGRSGMSYVHPFLRRNNWRNRNLCLAGNFNITNEKELFANMVQAQGQHPRSDADTFLILEQMGALLDENHSDLYRKFKKQGLRGEELNAKIEDNIDVEGVISEASRMWDGGFCIVGATGSGESFVFRDRWGIRPCYYYIDDEVIVAASERAAIQTALNVKYEKVQVLQPGEAVTIHKDGKYNISCLVKPENPRPCSFERIYFSRGSDADIYKERKMLGSLLTPQILKASPDLDHTVFSFIPNTAEVAFFGMLEGLNEHLDKIKSEKIMELFARAGKSLDKTAYGGVGEAVSKGMGDVADKTLNAAVTEVLSHKVRSEKLAIKDIKMRTFIAEGSSRNDMAAHVYDITYNSINPGKDSIAVIDDSIVRGTTLKQSIISILSRLEPKEIIIISSSPQIRYPDCYGIDMSRMGEFIAFNAAVALLKERGLDHILSDVYVKCKKAEAQPLENYNSTSYAIRNRKTRKKAVAGNEEPENAGFIVENYVKEIYAPFTDEEIAEKIAELVTPEGLKCPVKVIFQTIDNLHKACPDNAGDWYFSGDYPTPGGTRVAIQAYINWFEGNPYKRGYSR